jgi:hypothetical protein
LGEPLELDGWGHGGLILEVGLVFRQIEQVLDRFCTVNCPEVSDRFKISERFEVIVSWEEKGCEGITEQVVSSYGEGPVCLVGTTTLLYFSIGLRRETPVQLQSRKGSL